MMVVFVPLPIPRGPAGAAQPHGAPPPAQTKELDPQFAPVALSSPSPHLLGDFGRSVAVAPSFVVVGAPYEEVGEYGAAGHAYIENTATNAVIPLTSPDAQTGGFFGYSVATYGGLIVVGAPNEAVNSETGAGAVYVFNATGGLVTSISDPNAQPSGNFGDSVAIAGNYVVIGAPVESDSGCIQCGNAYLFDLQTDTIREISSPAPHSSGGFGSSVAISGTLVAVGAPEEPNGSMPDSGNVYVFSFVSGNDIASIANPAPATDAWFGTSVAINGTTVVGGAPGGSGGDGVAYQINLATDAVATLVSPNAITGGYFGGAVAADGVTVLVGAPEETSGGQPGAGNAYLFSETSGALISSDFNAPTWPFYGAFGQSVAELGSTILVGAPGVNASGISGAGQAYEFNQVPLTLESPNPVAGGENGFSTAMSNDYWVTGAPYEDGQGLTGAGNVYEVPVSPTVFPSTALASLSVETLSSPNAVVEGHFGYSVAIAGGWLVVGAPGELAGGYARAGHVYIYDAYTDALRYTLTSPNAQTGGEFGASVAVSTGGFVIVGAPFETASDFPEAGNAYAFSALTGVMVATFGSSYPTSYGYFGLSVGGSASQAVVGAPGETAGPNLGAGHAYLYYVDPESMITTMSSPNGQSYGNFGISVAMTPSHVVVGANGESAQTGLYDSGRAYLFNTNGGLLGTLTSPNVQEGGDFGVSVATNGLTVVVGAPGETALGDYAAGNVYVFTEAGAILDRYYSPTAVASGLFGRSVWDSSTRIVVGAPYEGGGSVPSESGRAYVFGFEYAEIDT